MWSFIMSHCQSSLQLMLCLYGLYSQRYATYILAQLCGNINCGSTVAGGSKGRQMLFITRNFVVGVITLKWWHRSSFSGLLQKFFNTPNFCKEVAKVGLLYFRHSKGKHIIKCDPRHSSIRSERTWARNWDRQLAGAKKLQRSVWYTDYRQKENTTHKKQS